MFQFPRCPPSRLHASAVTAVARGRVAPFGFPWIAGRQHLPRAFRRVAASFLGSRRLGILRAPIIPDRFRRSVFTVVVELRLTCFVSPRERGWTPLPRGTKDPRPSTRHTVRNSPHDGLRPAVHARIGQMTPIRRRRSTRPSKPVVSMTTVHLLARPNRSSPVVKVPCSDGRLTRVAKRPAQHLSIP